MTNKKRLKEVLENQSILNAKMDLILDLLGATDAQLKSIGGGGIKPPSNGGG